MSSHFLIQKPSQIDVLGPLRCSCCQNKACILPNGVKNKPLIMYITISCRCIGGSPVCHSCFQSMPTRVMRGYYVTCNNCYCQIDSACKYILPNNCSGYDSIHLSIGKHSSKSVITLEFSPNFSTYWS